MSIHNAAAVLKGQKAVQGIVSRHNIERATAELISRNAKPAIQLALAMAFQDLADHEPSGLAHEIVMRQVERYAQYGEKMYPLSEKQIAVIVQDVMR